MKKRVVVKYCVRLLQFVSFYSFLYLTCFCCECQALAMPDIGKPFTRDMAFTETKGGSTPNPVMLTGLTDDLLMQNDRNPLD